jgi:hypothetical protein
MNKYVYKYCALTPMANAMAMHKALENADNYRAMYDYWFSLSR